MTGVEHIYNPQKPGEHGKMTLNERHKRNEMRNCALSVEFHSCTWVQIHMQDKEYNHFTNQRFATIF